MRIVETHVRKLTFVKTAPYIWVMFVNDTKHAAEPQSDTGCLFDVSIGMM